MPFSPEQFFSVFATYNREIWPVQPVAYILGLAAILLVWRGAGARFHGRAVLLILAAMWARNGIAYHIVHFAPINPAAWAFGAAFVLQAVLFVRAAYSSDPPAFSFRERHTAIIGGGLVVYAAVVYPILGWLGGRGLEASPAFGVAPCPSTIFTLGMLALAEKGPPAFLAAIPIIWAFVGTSAAVLLDVPEDLGLAVAALAVLALIASRLFEKSAATELRRGATSERQS
jgi:hypothetical protein